MIVEADGGPLGAVVAGANVYDAMLLEATIEAIVVQRPDPSLNEQQLCLDKGYDNPSGEGAACDAQYTPHIRRIGEEKLDDRGRKRRPARRWVTWNERSLG